jgi:hypothetical protein
MPNRARQFEHAQDGSQARDTLVARVVEMQIGIGKPCPTLCLPEQRIKRSRSKLKHQRPGTHSGKLSGNAQHGGFCDRSEPAVTPCRCVLGVQIDQQHTGERIVPDKRGNSDLLPSLAGFRG